MIAATPGQKPRRVDPGGGQGLFLEELVQARRDPQGADLNPPGHADRRASVCSSITEPRSPITSSAV